MSPKLRRIGVFALVLVAIIGGVTFQRGRQERANQPKIITGTVERGDITTTVSATGVLEPLTTVEVKSNVGGQIMLLSVDEGDRVQAGQVIASIDPADTQNELEQMQADLEGARARVNQAQQGLIMQRQQNTAAIRSAEEAVIAARMRLAQAEKGAKVQTAVTTSSIEQAEQGVEAARARLTQAEAQAKLQPELSDSAIAQARSSLAGAKSSYQQIKTALVPQKLSSAQAAYDQAKANHEYAEKELARQKQLLAKGFVARSQVDAAEQSFRVAKAQLDSAGEKLNTVKAEANEDLQAAQAKVEQAEAALKNAEANRAQDNLKQQDVIAARAALKQAEAALRSARANREQDGVKQDEISAARAAVKQAESSLVSIRANSHQETMKADDITQARAQMKRSEASVANAYTQLGYATITAPRSGIVMKKYAEVGSIITAGRSSIGGGTGAGVSLVDIADTSRMFVKVNVDETDIAQIHIGQEVEITIDAFDRSHFSGRVTKIAPQTVVDQNVTTVPVTVELQRPDPRVKPGMNATCDFITARQRDVLLVPISAVKEEAARGAFRGSRGANGERRVPRTGGEVKPRGRRPQGPASYVMVMQGGKQVRRPVETGISDNDNTEIISGLREGDTIVTEIVQPQAPGMSSGGAGGGGRRGMRPF